MSEKKKAKKPVSPKQEENKIENKQPVGRPPLWTNPEALQHQIDEYFKREAKPTFAGLAVALGIDRKTLYNYEEKDEFFHTIKSARDRMMEIYEQHLMYGGNPTGVIFALKNFGWADNKQVDHTSKGKTLRIGMVSYDDDGDE